MKRYLFILTERGGGDRPPVIALAISLHDRGHDVLMLCDKATERSIAYKGLPTRTYPLELDRQGHIGNWISEIIKGDRAKVEQLPNPMNEWAFPLLPFAMEIAAQFRPTMIISTLFGMGLADQLALQTETPWCFVNPSFYFGKFATTGWEEDWYGPFIPRLARECFWPLVERANLVLHATDPEFDFQPSELLQNHHYVGFLFWEPPLAASSITHSTGDPWVLITLSSVKQENEVLFANSALQALASQPVRTILTQPDADIRGQLENIPSNATIAGFVPHSLILNRSELAINHAGHGIVSKALYYGVPMVLIPWDRDQPGVARRAEKLGVARVVSRENATPDEVKNAIEMLRADKRYQTAAQHHSDRLRKIDSLDLAIKRIENYG